MDRWHIRVSRRLRGRLRAALLGRHGVGIVADTRNGMLLLDPRDYTVSKKLLRHGEYDWPVIEALTAILQSRPGPLLVIGCHLGALLVPLARVAESTLGFEANPRNFALLRANVRLNALDAVRIENRAVMDAEGEVRISHDLINSGASHVDMASGDRPATTSVPAIALDRWFDGQPPAFRLAVMDAEGAESHIIDGGERTFAAVELLYTEVSPRSLGRQGRSLGRLADQLARHFSYAHDIQSGAPQAIPGAVADVVRRFEGSREVHNLLLSKRVLVAQDRVGA